MKINIIIATVKSWNIDNAHIFLKDYSDIYNTYIITDTSELNINEINKIKPDYIFFPHWSWIIPREIYNNYICIVFHITDLPFGRGGSPLQNLIIQKINNTKISAIRVNQGLDTGDIYLKHDLFIGLGSANEILQLTSNIIFENMIPIILSNNIIPTKQIGQVTSFKRRSPEESNLIKNSFSNINDIYNFIRMLDGEGYPNAFLKIDNLKISFSEINNKGKKLVGRFEITYEE